jgi:DNA-binding transcriptional ArsR family regulator
VTDSLEDRVAALEQALQAMQAEPAEGPPTGSLPADPGLWLLQGLKRHLPADAVAFGGTATAAEGPIAWQWAVPTDQLREQDWEPAATVLDALSHPVRLRLLQRVLNGTATTAELAEDETLGTTGQLHHHLRALVAAGWLTSTGRGRWSIPGPRVIPLLVVIVAATTR